MLQPADGKPQLTARDKIEREQLGMRVFDRIDRIHKIPAARIL
jgi:hypothetical protein